MDIDLVSLMADIPAFTKFMIGAAIIVATIVFRYYTKQLNLDLEKLEKTYTTAPTNNGNNLKGTQQQQVKGPTSSDSSHKLRRPRSGSEKEEIPLDRSNKKMSLEKLAKSVPDWKAPVGPVCSRFMTERTLLARRMMRLTSKSKWEMRVLLLSTDGLVLICDNNTNVRRQLTAEMIVKGTLITHWEGTALKLEVKDQHQLIVAPHRGANEDQTIDHVLAILRHFNPSMVVDSTVSESKGSLKSLFNDNELKKQSSSGHINPLDLPSGDVEEELSATTKSELESGHQLAGVLTGEEDLKDALESPRKPRKE